MVVILQASLQRTRQEDAFQPLQQRITDLVVKARGDLEVGSGKIVNERIREARAELDAAQKEALQMLYAPNRPASLELPIRERVNQLRNAVKCLVSVENVYRALELGDVDNARWNLG